MKPLITTTARVPDKPGKALHWGQLSGASLGLALAELVNSQQHPIVAIVPDSLTAHRLETECRFFLGDNADVVLFPDWETLPYDNFSPHQDIISQRLACLYRLTTLQRGLLIVPVATLMQRIAPKDTITQASFVLATGERFDPDAMRQQLGSRGYRAVSQVYERGEFAIRGSIFDVFPMGSALPYRIDLLDDDVDSIRTFDPETQRSIKKIERIDLLPAREFPLDETAISRFREQWRARFGGKPMECPTYANITEGICTPGIEYYLPLFFTETASLLDYMPTDTMVCTIGDCNNAGQLYWQEINERYEQCNFDPTRPFLPPAEVFYSQDELHSKIKQYCRLQYHRDGINDDAMHSNLNTSKPPLLPVDHKQTNPLAAFMDYHDQHTGRVLICAETAGRRETLLTLMAKHGLHPHPVEAWQDFLTDDNPLCITIAPLESGMVLPEHGISLIAESQFFGEQIFQRRRRKQQRTEPSEDTVVRNLAELEINSPVVHLDHGIGRYLGLQTINSGDMQAEYVTLEYADDAKLYVPVSSLHLISRYSGVDADHAPLHRLGSKQWDKAKQKAAKQVRDVAAELLNVYAQRASRKGHQYQAPDNDYARFASAFPFEPTPDQERAIDDVLGDMHSENPMDRLVCGDVGFGKTEVAMRAAYMAVRDNKQVAVLVPTTLLAQQHYETFTDRFADFAVNIDVISRFRSKAEQTQILEKLKRHDIDILIGTHKLIQEDVNFKSLGLLIIDEEHRFGVRQKERLKALRAEVDILTLTATPIPRTLNMSLSGLRELSIIATPPAKRLSIKTFVHERNKGIIREAIMREIMRGGQVYFLHNNVETIQRTCQDLAELVPEATIHFAHGQMRERELEHMMSEFYHQRFNVLVCTTIIETGIDIPTANTIIIDRADKFGLAQLHQLRGRVGRSHHQAYAYLMTPMPKTLSKDAQKRLEAISQLEDLGVGFMLATHDLEIRGAGEVLGDEQSGNIQAIGFTLYMELLDRAVAALKDGQDIDLETPLKQGPEVDLHMANLIPDDYLPDVQQRLILYKRIANARDDRQLDEIQVEMIDRFGLLPQPCKNLFEITRLRHKASTLGLEKIEASEKKGYFEFAQNANIDPIVLIKLVQEQPHCYKLKGPTRLEFSLDETRMGPRLAFIDDLLTQLAGDQVQ